jgi:hypothetical protein
LEVGKEKGPEDQGLFESGAEERIRQAAYRPIRLRSPRAILFVKLQLSVSVRPAMFVLFR